ncbi:TetR family transcriptional regulator [Nocardia bhagyanarayanae]|uniref:TetR family transcriptional regulator n=1 Tax=Nocardia bhagyanarayanae TaxID=1215925 RepID=A0A543EXL7_9NOCA|nr:TetR/AcrR family transcriptional regulator [Nocardia bhagyanarayanae]TQM26326.1 TetR family transcriptional regulator [Nocardia bhagyanarayanae]
MQQVTSAADRAELRISEAELAMPTDRRLILAAERLFAERGIDAVSLRAVMSAAGANVAAVHYHFGSKEALIEALIRQRSDAVATRRAALLDEVEQSGVVSARGLAEAFVLPVWEMATGEGGSWVKFIASVLGSGHPALSTVAEGFADQARRFMTLLGRAFPDLPRHTIRFRLAQAMTLTFQVLGDVHQTQDLLAISGVQLSPEQVMSELVDVVTAILAGPPSD